MMFQISVNDFAALKPMCSAIVSDIVSLLTAVGGRNQDSPFTILIAFARFPCFYAC